MLATRAQQDPHPQLDVVDRLGELADLWREGKCGAGRYLEMDHHRVVAHRQQPPMERPTHHFDVLGLWVAKGVPLPVGAPPSPLPPPWLPPLPWPSSWPVESP